MMNSIEMPALTGHAPPYTVGDALRVLEALKVSPRDIHFVVVKENPTFPEIKAQEPLPGTLLDPGAPATLYVNILAAPSDTVEDIVVDIRRELQFSQTRSEAAGKLLGLLHDLKLRIRPEGWERDYLLWQDKRTSQGLGVPLREWLQGGLEALEGQLRTIASDAGERDGAFVDELVEALADAAFVDDLLGRTTVGEAWNKLVREESRFYFFGSHITHEAEATLPGRQQDLDKAKSYLIYLYARLELHQHAGHDSLIAILLADLLRAGGLHYTPRELDALFPGFHLKRLYTDLQRRSNQAFTMEGYLRCLAGYLPQVDPSSFQWRWQGETIQVVYTGMEREDNRKRVEVLNFFLVPITVPIQYDWQDTNGYLILGREGKNNIGQALLA